jgi:hypothetical protein
MMIFLWGKISKIPRYQRIAECWDFYRGKIPINGDFTFSGTVVTLQQIFVILYKDEF